MTGFNPVSLLSKRTSYRRYIILKSIHNVMKEINFLTKTEYKLKKYVKQMT